MACSSNQACTVISVRLDETNYHIWLFFMQHYLRGHGLLKFVDDSYPCPSKSVIGNDGLLSISNSNAYERWLEHDSFVISMITNTLCPDALTLVVGCQSAMEVWLTLKKRYANVSESRIMQLKSAMQSIQKGSDSIEKYLLKFKSIRDQLAAVGVRMTNQDVKVLILAGLPSEYGHTRQIIRGKSNVDLEEVRSLLLSAECEIELENKSASLAPFAAKPAMLAQNGMFHNPNYGMNSGLMPSTDFGQPFGMQSILLSSLDNHGATQNSMSPCVNYDMTNMHQYSASPATTQYGFVTPQTTMTASTGFVVPPTSVTSPTTFQHNFNLPNGSYQSMSSMGNNTFIMNNNLGTEGSYNSMPSRFDFSHQSAGCLAQNGCNASVSYGNQKQQAHTMNNCNYNNLSQQNAVMLQQQLSQKNAQTVASNNGYQQGIFSNSYSDGGYSDGSVSYPNDKGTNNYNNRTNNNNAKPRNTGNFINVIVCQIYEKPGHGAWKCFQRNTRPQNGASTSSVICQICKKPGHSTVSCRYMKFLTNSHNGHQAILAYCQNTPPTHGVWHIDYGATNHMTSNINHSPLQKVLKTHHYAAFLKFPVPYLLIPAAT
ncbi:putative RNA-directed DNA polymerase [Rosa chinensis]|uniref:Putative RNA-directed DNA polymerase n=1 Tax=Rosa chinensis TaxID=74649 RepID=A0A2P6R260_ROSCH|nr:putative RNA-directed DNA polymerase [Rosa chinensis]